MYLREFTTGFYFHKPDATTQIYDSNTYVKNYTYIGTVETVFEDEASRWSRKTSSQWERTIEIMEAGRQKSGRHSGGDPK